MNYYYSGQGSLLIATRTGAGQPAGFTELGNVPNCEVSIEVAKFEHKESESGSRAVDLSLVNEKKGTFTMTLESMSPDNLATAFWGTSTVNAAGVAATATVLLYLAKSSPLPFPGVSSVVIKDTATGLITYEFGTSLTDVLSLNGWVDQTNGSIHVFSDADQTTNGAAANITNGMSVAVTYNHVANNRLDAFTETSMERWLRFEGMNTVDGKAVIVDIFKAQLDPMQGYGLINEEIGSFTVSGSMLYDSLQTSGSKFFRQINVS
jgi:hypothetical protein